MKRYFPLLVALGCGGRTEAEPTLDAANRGPDAAASATGNSTSSELPKEAIAQIAVNGGRACALGEAGTISCWELTHNRPYTVTEVGRASGAVQIAVSTSFLDHKVYARLRDGRVVWFFARNTRAQGQAVVGLADVIQISAGGAHVCALLRGGTVSCWGENVSGQLGSGFEGARSESPILVAGLGGIVEISAGEFSTCARDSSGSVKCWGRALGGQLGDDAPEGAHPVCVGADACSRQPIAVAGLSDATALTGGLNCNCAERRDGPPVCWGSMSTDAYCGRPEPTRFAAGTSMVAAYTEMCGLFGGALRCTDAPGVGELRPIVVGSPLGPLKTVAGGWNAMCAILADGQITCWEKDGPPTSITFTP